MGFWKQLPANQRGRVPAAEDNNQFAGQEYDAETDTDHATFRQYSPVAGRWMSPDPYDGSYDLSNSQSLNRYSYVLNNTFSLTDPTGLQYGDPIRSRGGDCAFCNVFNNIGSGIASLFGRGTSFHGSTQPRPDENGVFTRSSYHAEHFGSASYRFASFNLALFSNPNNPSPCAPPGTTPAPTVYQQRGQPANNMTTAYDPYGMSSAAGAIYNAQELHQFNRGGPLDAQVRYGGSTAYANYVFGMYLSAAGWTLLQTLAAANDHAAARSSYRNHPPVDSNYRSTPASNVTNITAGYNAQQSGTLCHK